MYQLPAGTGSCFTPAAHGSCLDAHHGSHAGVHFSHLEQLVQVHLADHGFSCSSQPGSHAGVQWLHALHPIHVHFERHGFSSFAHHGSHLAHLSQSEQPNHSHFCAL